MLSYLSPVSASPTFGTPDSCSVLQHDQEKRSEWLHSTMFSENGSGLSPLSTERPVRVGSECIHPLLQPWSSTRETLMLVVKGLNLLAWWSRANFSSISSLESMKSSLSSSVGKQVEGEKAAGTKVFIYSAHISYKNPL